MQDANSSASSVPGEPTGRVTVREIPCDDIRSLGLHVKGRALFAYDERELLDPRTKPMLPTLTKRATHVNFEALQQRLHVFIGASGAGKTIRMLQVALDEANVDVAVYCCLTDLLTSEMRRRQRTAETGKDVEAQDPDQVKVQFLRFLNNNASAFLRSEQTQSVALLIDECGACPDFVRAVASQHSEIQKAFRDKFAVDLVVIAAGAGAVTRSFWDSNTSDNATVVSVDPPPNLQQGLEDECPWLKLLNKGKASKWYTAMMLNARAATCLARTFKDPGRWLLLSENAVADWVAPDALTKAALSFKSMNDLSRCSPHDLQRIHARAAHIAANGTRGDCRYTNSQLVRSYAVLTDEWAASPDPDHTRPRYKIDVGSHVVLLLTCGVVADALAGTEEEVGAEALARIRWCISVGDAAGPSAEHVHFNSMFRCTMPAAPFVPPESDEMEDERGYLGPAASVVWRYDESDRRSRSVRTFVLKHRIDPTFTKHVLPAKLAQIGAVDVAAKFNDGEITSLRDLAIALSDSENYRFTKKHNDWLPLALMQAVLDTSDDVWIFQNAPGAEFADIIVVWNTAVWLIRAKHYEESMHQEWRIFNDEHKMGSGTVEADSAACVSAATVSQLISNGHDEFCSGESVRRDVLFEHLKQIIEKDPRAAQERARGALEDLDGPVKLVQFLFGAREVRRAHVVYTDEAITVPGGVVLKQVPSDSLMLPEPWVSVPSESSSRENLPLTRSELPTTVSYTGNRMGGFAGKRRACYAGAVLSLLLQDSTIRNTALLISLSSSSPKSHCSSMTLHETLFTIIGDCQRNAGTLEPLRYNFRGPAALDGFQRDAQDFLVALFSQIQAEETEKIRNRKAKRRPPTAGLAIGEDASDPVLRKRGRGDVPAPSQVRSLATRDGGAVEPSLRKGRKGEKTVLPDVASDDSDACWLSQLIEGQVIETTVCRHCGGRRSTDERFTCLSVPCMRSVRESGGAYFASVEDVTDSVCGECHHSGTLCKKKTGFASLPAKLFIHLKRFSDTGVKNNVPVSVDETLRLRETTPDGAHVTRNYSLTGVLQHHGNSIEAGHCTARVLCDDQRWYQINDDVVSTTSAPDRASNSYILLYTREE